MSAHKIINKSGVWTGAESKSIKQSQLNVSMAQVKILATSEVAIVEPKRHNMMIMTEVEKSRMKKELSQLLKKTLTAEQRSTLEKMGIYCPTMGKMNLDFQGFDDRVLLELKRELKNPLLSTRISERIIDPSPRKDGGGGNDNEQEEAGARRALRAAMLKSRFADTIARANGTTPQVVAVRQETLRLKRPREEMLDQKNMAESKRRRLEKQREAARFALEMVEKKVKIEDNFQSLKELHILMQCSAVAYSVDASSGHSEMALRDWKTGAILRPLEQFGLHLKEPQEEEEEERIIMAGEAEEGEIIDY